MKFNSIEDLRKGWEFVQNNPDILGNNEELK